ncbi:two-component system histidine kinase PnpS [Peribacillus huizhouensis]|uniref:histidine kinase n=1 Tax=Peribacillus huizhouensis TaxID=1501239 RepID=A0ABR6CNA1_9BACI|nr:ATP-binding protein [Peribacillus huizhouensis]MBA9025857.1 two-component system phosphate regulon sensor histidine kinase PhoR [Peribacillus huizhouensis]
MTKFKTKLLVAIISLIIIVLLAEGLLLGQVFKNYYVHTFNERIERETNFIANYIQEHGGVSEFIHQGKTEDLANLHDDNFTIINNDGLILYDDNVNRNSHPERHKDMLRSIAKRLESGKQSGIVEGPKGLQYYYQTIQKGGAIEGAAVLSNEIEAIDQVNSQIWWILTISLIASLCIITMFASKIASRYSRPIEAAATTAIELAEGNYRARTYERSSDEIGILSKSLNILARNLQEMQIARDLHQDRLETLIENIGSGVLQIDHKGHITMTNLAYKQQFNMEDTELLYKVYYEVIPYAEIIAIIEEIFMTEKSIKRQVLIPLSIERKHFEVYGAPIIVKNDEWKGIIIVFHDITELKKLEQMRKDFVANVSHELKTPITSIKGFSETLLDGALKDEQALYDFLKIILSESDRLQELIQELLDLSKIEQQDFVLQIDSVNVSTILEESMAMLCGKAEEKNITLILESKSPSLWVEGEANRIKQIFINLITNALNYTSSEGEVKIEASEDADNVRVAVQDNGIGIESKELPRIFERFYRVDKARSRDSGGTGLGLAIVKHILEVHKGRITVESSPGKGTTFTVFLKKHIR